MNEMIEALRKRFEELAHEQYQARRAEKKVIDDSVEELPRESLFWRQEDGSYGVLEWNGAWWGYRMGFKDGALAKVSAAETPTNTIYTQAYDKDGKLTVRGTRSTSEPSRDLHIMNTAIEFFYAVQRGVNITPEVLWKHVMGADWEPKAAGGLVTSGMVDRFLGWRLPDDFFPDCGITFKQLNAPNSWPIGTNLLTATQARAMLEHVLSVAPAAPAPIDMVLHCPKCGIQHIDAPERSLGPGNTESVDWTNPPHRSHLCHACGHIWRPADVPTNGVAAVATRGKDDSPAAGVGVKR